MALLDLPAPASLPRPDGEVGRGQAEDHPGLRPVLRRVGANLLVACAVPAVIFYSLFATFGVWPAIVGALCWSYGAIAVRALAGRGPSGMLFLTAGVLTLKTLVVLASHSTFIYFLQPVLTDLAVGFVFLVSAMTARPAVARLAGDFYPLTPELEARPAIQQLFRQLTLLWAIALLVKAGTMYTLLQNQPLGTFVLAKSILVPVTNATCILLTVLVATSVARREGMLPSKAEILPACPSRTSTVTP